MCLLYPSDALIEQNSLQSPLHEKMIGFQNQAKRLYISKPHVIRGFQTLKKIGVGVFVLVTIAVIVMAVWTQAIGSTTLAERGEKATAGFETNYGDPMNGEVSIASHSTMLESKPTWISYNISLEIPGGSPMNLKVDYIDFVFTASDFAYQPEDAIESVGYVESRIIVVNATSVIIHGSTQITPIMPQGDATGFLGCSIGYRTWENGTPKPPVGIDYEVGVIQLRPFTIVPAYLAKEPWFSAMETLLLVWVVLIIYFVCSKAKG